jgi:hypothetical protein
VKLPEGDRLQDAIDMWHDDSWSGCPGGKPVVADVQMPYVLAVLERWFREEFAPRRTQPIARKASAAKPRRQPGEMSSSRVPKRIRDAVLARDGFCCQRCGVGLRVSDGDYSLQHRDNRGMGGSKRKHTLANLVALCGSATTGCHGHVESQPLESDRLGWSVPSGVTPEEWPVLRFGTRWEQPGDEWVPAVPHPDQIEMGAVA